MLDDLRVPAIIARRSKIVSGVGPHVFESEQLTFKFINTSKGTLIGIRHVLIWLPESLVVDRFFNRFDFIFESSDALVKISEERM